MGRYGSLDYARLTKGGFFLGLGLFVLGATGELVGHLVYGSLPAWEHTLFFYAEVFGLLIGFFSPWVFGVLLPLTE
ncbi:hypothetical protein [Natrialba sp. SSL1]|uniref:DUF7860 family protein n=1 Tax=Natrialba sp. SSL1 TaxID=1869245 RepID=UPI0008F7E8E8|nr:hypothetical protein [Natrialba sp. SSL1]OIB56022.1 hypothetical protein BBD46_21240 [Natrialba sp. SSL1]